MITTLNILALVSFANTTERVRKGEEGGGGWCCGEERDRQKDRDRDREK